MAHSGYRNNKQMLQTVIISFMRQWKKNKPLLIPIQRGYIQRRRNNQRKLEKNLLEYIEDKNTITRKNFDSSRDGDGNAENSNAYC